MPLRASDRNHKLGETDGRPGSPLVAEDGSLYCAMARCAWFMIIFVGVGTLQYSLRGPESGESLFALSRVTTMTETP